MVDNRYKSARRATLIGAFVNTLLGLIKVCAGVIYQSHALFADGIHSFSDLITDATVLFAAKFGSQDADISHPYGHQRIETAATMLLALLLILAGFGIGWDALENLMYHHSASAMLQSVVVAVISIACNEMLFHYTHYIGTTINSSLIIANAWHHRSDAAASLVVLFGLIGSMMGYTFFDPIAALVVGLLICKMGITYGWNSIKELVDTAVDSETLSIIHSTITAVQGVCKIHQLRSRLMGGDILIDVHILVSPRISVSEGHFIAQQVHGALLKRLPRLQDVVVHVDPEDDELNQPCVSLLNRLQLEEHLFLPWQQECTHLENWVLHYLDGKIYVDLFFSDTVNPPSFLQQRVAADVLHFPEIKKVRFLSTFAIIHGEIQSDVG